MTLRSYLYSTLTSDPELQAYHHGQVFQTGAMRTARVTPPYLVYHIGNETNSNLSEDRTAGIRYFQVYIYDVPGDYQRLDEIGKKVKRLLLGRGSPHDGIITTRYLERSQDLMDESMGAIFNYLRFQFIVNE